MPQRGTAPLVGRDGELRTLRTAVDAACAGHGSTWLVVGQPGIGKTRLVTEARLYAESVGARTVHAFSWDQGGAPAFWPWRMAARALGLDVLSDSEPHDDGDRFALFAGLLDQLRDAAAEQPTVIVLDDLHEADLATMLLLRFIAEGITDAAVMLMGTYRRADLLQRSELAEDGLAHLDQAARHGGQIELGGLGAVDVGKLLENYSVDQQPGGFEGALVERVATLTQGNPLFVQHLASQLAVAAPDDALADLDVPDGIRRILVSRLDWVAPETRRLLRTAAVIGPDVDLEMLADVECDAIAGDEAAVRRMLAEISELVFVRVDNSTLSFQHPLVREVLIAELDEEPRCRLHAAVAEWLADHRPADSEEIAYHLHRAGPERAVEAAKASASAAQRALDALAFENAVTHAQRAVDAIDRAPVAGADPPLDAFRADLLFGLGRACWRASRRPESDAAYDAAFDIARRLDDTARMTSGALGAGFPKAFGTVFPNERAQRCRVVLDRLDPGPSVARSLLLSKLACELIGQPDPTDSRAAALEALAVAREVDDLRCIGEALASVLVTDLGPDELDDRLAQSDEMLDISRSTGDPALAVQARFQLVGALVQRGDRQRLEAIVAEQHRGVHALAEPGFLRHDVWFRAMLTTVDGDIERAEVLVDEGLSAANVAHDPDAFVVWGAQLGVVRWMQGRVNELEPLYRDMANGSNEPVWSAVLAWLWSRNGMHAAARGLLDRLSPDHLLAASRDRNWMLAAVTAAEVASRSGTADEIDGFIELLGPYRDDFVPIAMGISFWGTVARPLAMLYLARGDVDASVDLYERAIAATASFGAIPWLVEVQLDLADLLVRHCPDERERALALIDEAAAAARRVGLVEQIQRAETLEGRMSSTVDLSTPSDVVDGAVPCRIRIDVLGGFRCVDTSGVEVRWSSRRARSVLKRLVAARGGRVTRESLMEQVWPGDDPGVVANRLSVALSTIRRSLDPDQVYGRNEIVVADRETIWIAAEDICVDLELFVAAAHDALHTRRDDDSELDRLLAAVAAYGGMPFADDPYDHAWGSVRAETLVLYSELSRSIARIATTTGRTVMAARALNDLLTVDPFDESAHLALIELHRISGAHGLVELAVERHGAAFGPD